MTEICTAVSDDGFACTLSLAQHGVDHFNRTRNPRDWPDPERLRLRSRPIGKAKGGAKREAVAAANAHDKDTDKRVGPVVLSDLNEPHAYLRSAPHHTEARAADVTKVSGSRRRKQVLRAIFRAAHGATDDEVAVALDDPDVPAPRVASRRKELEEGGWVEPLVRDGVQVTRRTRAGNDALVWVLTPSGRANIGPWLDEQ